MSDVVDKQKLLDKLQYSMGVAKKHPQDPYYQGLFRQALHIFVLLEDGYFDVEEDGE